MMTNDVFDTLQRSPSEPRKPETRAHMYPDMELVFDHQKSTPTDRTAFADGAPE